MLVWIVGNAAGVFDFSKQQVRQPCIQRGIDLYGIFRSGQRSFRDRRFREVGQQDPYLGLLVRNAVEFYGSLVVEKALQPHSHIAKTDALRRIPVAYQFLADTSEIVFRYAKSVVDHRDHSLMTVFQIAGADQDPCAACVHADPMRNTVFHKRLENQTGDLDLVEPFIQVKVKINPVTEPFFLDTDIAVQKSPVPVPA